MLCHHMSERGGTDIVDISGIPRWKVLDRDGSQVIIPNDKHLDRLHVSAALKNYICSAETKVTRIGN